MITCKCCKRELKDPTHQILYIYSGKHNSPFDAAQDTYLCYDCRECSPDKCGLVSSDDAA